MKIKMSVLTKDEIDSLKKIGFEENGDVIEIDPDFLHSPGNRSTFYTEEKYDDELVYSIYFGFYDQEQKVATIELANGCSVAAVDHKKINDLLTQLGEPTTFIFEDIPLDEVTPVDEKTKNGAQRAKEAGERKKHLEPVIAKLDALKAKRADFVAQAGKEKNKAKKLKYEKVEQAISQISAHLDKLIKEYTVGTKDLAFFKLAIQNMRTAPDMANNIKTLESHRGTKQLLLNILSAIFTLGVSLVYGAMTGKHNFSIFKAPTDSSKKLQEVDQEINKILPISKT